MKLLRIGGKVLRLSKFTWSEECVGEDGRPGYVLHFGRSSVPLEGDAAMAWARFLAEECEVVDLEPPDDSPRTFFAPDPDDPPCSGRGDAPGQAHGGEEGP